MITENNWVQTNIDEYCEKEKGADFVFTLIPYNFKKKSFRVAAEQAAKNIYRDVKKPLYILFSGGADSEFVVRLFHRLKIPFTAVIVDTGLNQLETKIARLVCEQLDIKPHIIETNEEEVMNFYLNIMFKRKNGRSSDSVPVLMGFEYINSVGGVGITGATPAYDGNIQNVAVSANEVYPDRFKYDYIGFFYYNIEIFYATLAAIKDAKTSEEFKSRTYGTVYRNKSMMNYSINSHKIFQHIYSRAINKLYYKMGSVQEVLEYLKKWSI